MKRRTFIKNTGVLGLATLVTPVGIIQANGRKAEGDDFAGNFSKPPSSAKPHTWWHWMNGNVTREGITLDLEAMARAGIGGFQNFDAGTGIPKGPVQYLSPEWLELKRHAINEADRLGLEFTMHNCPGWSSTGGPWITPELSMQEVTWSEIRIDGGNETSLRLPQPLTRLNFYTDIAVIACRALPDELTSAPDIKSIRTNRSAVDPKLISGELPEGVLVEPDQNGSGNPAYLRFEFREERTVQSVSFLTSAQQAGPVLVQVSDNGTDFRDVISLGGGGGFGAPVSGQLFLTANFSPQRAKYFRLACNQSRHFTQVRFSNIPRVDGWQKRANYSFNGNGVENISSGTAIGRDGIVDVTKYFRDGTLAWNAPAGIWTILRFGYTPLGTMNRSAPDTGVGLECDKYNGAAMEFHFNKMMENLLPDLKGIAGRSKAGLLIDSYEVGMQNWTPGFEDEFQERNGYSILPYLPAITGRVVETADITDRFLWDLRRTQGDLMADNYYGKFTALCHRHNLVSYIQPYDRGPMEEMQIGSRIDINVGEFWNNLSSIFQNNWTMRRTVKLSAAIAHTNGQKVVAAESYTGEPESSRWQEYPFAMKALGDKMFTQGLNRIVFHRFAHQPHPTARPGMTMGPWGIHFDRTNTWWEGGKAWIEYISRCQYLLQYGTFVADLIYFTGEDAGTYTSVTPDKLNPPPPAGYDYDLINAEVLNKAGVSGTHLSLPSGTQYSILVLQEQKTMSLELIRKIRQLVQDGLTVVGAKPERTPGLRHRSDDDREFRKIAGELWGPVNGSSVTTNRVGKGTVIWGVQLSIILEGMGLVPDVNISSSSGDAAVTFIHRRDGEKDIYFLANQRRREESLVCSFRVGNKLPELWDPLTGGITRVSVWKAEKNVVTVPVHLSQQGSVFVVFRTVPDSRSLNTVSSSSGRILTTDHFPAPGRRLFPNLTNTFTISCWVKPENNVMLGTRNFMDGLDPWTDNFAIYPASGEKLYGPGHATCGLAVGRNGVAVWEHGGKKPVFVLGVPSPLSGWTHVALAYQDGAPSVYINGTFIQKGGQSGAMVHPGIGEAYLQEGASYFNGDMTEPSLAGRVLNEDQLKGLMSVKHDFAYHSTRVVEENGGDKKQLVFLKNGDFEISESTGGKRKISIEGLGSQDLTADWQVTFPESSGAPASVLLKELISLHDHNEDGVKYFSGTSTYKKTFFFSARSKRNDKRRTYLELGQVEVMAEVILNGINLGIFWARPYRIDVTGTIKAGQNELEVRVTNQWPNRLIGDEQLPEPYRYSPGAGGSGFASLSGGAILELPEWYRNGKPMPDNGRVTFTTWKHYTKDSPLLPSGLIGPVRLTTGLAVDV